MRVPDGTLRYNETWDISRDLVDITISEVADVEAGVDWIEVNKNQMPTRQILVCKAFLFDPC